jgi:hypothetical protein
MADMDPRTGRLDRLTISCACGYSVTWPRKMILARCGPDVRPLDLARRLKCVCCGTIGKARVHGGKY